MNDEARERILTRLGAPKTKDAYGLKAGDGDDPATLEWFSDVALKARLLPDQVRMVLAEHTAKTNELIAQEKAANEQAMQAATVALKAKWGNQYDRNVAIAENVVGALKLPKEFLGAVAQAVGHSGLVEGFYSIAHMLGEDRFVTQGTPATNSGFTPDAARARKAEMMADREFQKRMATNTLTAKDKQEWNQVHEAMTGGQ